MASPRKRRERKAARAETGNTVLEAKNEVEVEHKIEEVTVELTEAVLEAPAAQEEVELARTNSDSNGKKKKSKKNKSNKKGTINLFGGDDN